jgi:hypothetical protein
MTMMADGQAEVSAPTKTFRTATHLTKEKNQQTNKTVCNISYAETEYR